MDRRTFLAMLGLLGLSPAILKALQSQSDFIQKPIPKTGELIPAIGMGTWITFNVGSDENLRNARLEVLKTFFERGGGMVDSSPMYGSAEEVMGYCLDKLGETPSLFSATKVWTALGFNGPGQMKESEELWGGIRFDLMQIHNLLGWESHLETLLEWKEKGRIRYIGITTSHGSRHSEMERIMTSKPIDFVQFTYNVLDREAESRLLPIARERDLGVIINRPFRRGSLFDQFEQKPLPPFAAEFGAENWAQVFLKFIISHPAVTCAIPATSQVPHMRENMGACYGRLPDAPMRRKITEYVRTL